MSRFIELKLSIREYENGGDERQIREITAETTGSGTRDPWLRLQLHGSPMTPNELEGVNQVMAGFKKMLEP